MLPKPKENRTKVRKKGIVSIHGWKILSRLQLAGNSLFWYFDIWYVFYCKATSL